MMIFIRLLRKLRALRMFLERYKNTKLLGKGGFATVHLVEDTKDQNKLYALKIIDLRSVPQDQKEEFISYLKGEEESMKIMNSPHILKLLKVVNMPSQKKVYFLLQYCDGGDLCSYQRNQPNRVFRLDQTTQILAQIITGLEQLHQNGFLHRDIKGQNILINYEKGKSIYKLADFGFCKKTSEISGTILGTYYFMSPEIYFSDRSNEAYGFQVDMWAFGVLFYFMLNVEYPFNLEPNKKRLTCAQRGKILIQKASNFSYRRAVENTNQKIMENCTPEMQDLFRKMFEVDPSLRISFSDLRKHPIFVKHFPSISEACRKTYSLKYKPNRNILIDYCQELMTTLSHQQVKEDRKEQTIIRKEEKSYLIEREILQKRAKQIDFLLAMAEDFQGSGGFLKPIEALMITFNLQKYYTILMKQLIETLNKNKLSIMYPGLKWNEFTNTNQFRGIYFEISDNANRAELKFRNLYNKCHQSISEIMNINPPFKSAFNPIISETAFEGNFKESYRKSTTYIFQVLRKQMKTKKDIRLNYLVAICLISHSYNNLFSDKESVAQVFKEYFEEKRKTVDQIDFLELREWMKKKQAMALDWIGKNIIHIYFKA